MYILYTIHVHNSVLIVVLYVYVAPEVFQHNMCSFQQETHLSQRDCVTLSVTEYYG